MRETAGDLMVHFRAALERHELAVQSFLNHPNQQNSEQMALAFQEAQELRTEIKRLLSQHESAMGS